MVAKIDTSLNKGKINVRNYFFFRGIKIKNKKHTRYIHFYYYQWIDTSAGGLLVPMVSFTQ